jgi:hypothetical protein
MGDTDVWINRDGSVPTFSALFTTPKHCDDAIEAVRLLPKRVDRLHVRKLLWEAQRSLNMERFWTQSKGKAQRLLEAIEVVNASIRPVPLLDLEQEMRRSRPVRQRGHPTMPYYRMAKAHLRSIGVSERLAIAMLRGIGVPIPGPTTQS